MIRFNLTCCGLLTLILFVGCSNPADDVAPADVSDAKESPAATDGSSDAAKSYVISEESKIDFTGSKITGSHDGGFKAFEGSFSVVDGQLVPAGQTIQIDMTSTWSDSDKLTGHLLNEDFFAVEEFPTSTFTITAVEPADSGSTVTGNLTLRGVTKSISFPAEIQVSDEQVTLKAEFYIKRFDFDIKYPGRADDLIRDEVVIRLDVTANAG
jgi:polyisoprenoid-binding protein YceI